MTTPTLPAAFTPFAEPKRKVTAGWIALFATAWLGIWMAQLTPVQLLLPLQIDGLLKPTGWTESVVAFGIISGIAGACALVTYPLTGAFSDRTTSRFGRRPWILAGTVVFAMSLILLSVQGTIVGIGIFWSLAIIGFCMASAAITATISDQVPVLQRGLVSGFVSAPQAVGTVLGILLVTELMLSQIVGYTLVAVALLVLVIPFVLLIPDEVLPKVLRAPFTLGALLKGFWINPVAHPDFGWTLFSRILVNLGNALGTTLLLYFIMFGLNRPETAEDDLLQLTIIYLVTFIIASLGFGRLSDVLRKRKPFVYAAAYLQGLAALLLAFVPDFSIAMVGAALLGLGYGCFMAVPGAAELAHPRQGSGHHEHRDRRSPGRRPAARVRDRRRARRLHRPVRRVGGVRGARRAGRHPDSQRQVAPAGHYLHRSTSTRAIRERLVER